MRKKCLTCEKKMNKNKMFYECKVGIEKIENYKKRQKEKYEMKKMHVNLHNKKRETKRKLCI